MSVTYDRDRSQLTCPPEVFDTIVAAVHGEGPLPDTSELRAAGVVSDGSFDAGLGLPLAGIVSALRAGTVRVVSVERTLQHRFWLASGVVTWWVDGGDGEGRLFALPAELFAHTVVDLVAFAARRVPGDVEPEIPTSFAWTPPGADATPDTMRASLARLAEQHRERHLVESLQADIWLFWEVSASDFHLTGLDTAFGAYVGADAAWTLLPGRTLWRTLTGWQPHTSESTLAAGTRP